MDVRTIIRWGAIQSLIKAEKEKDLIDETFIPFQLIRNLNAAVSIPTYYDFALRKYALAEISIKLPSSLWIKEQLGTKLIWENSPERGGKYIEQTGITL
ncbi:MAG: hypothetical protein GXO88_11910 [Chlorobi bacterium]|nr:hypothetical protein [Chlorobiota bacterium]